MLNNFIHPAFGTYFRCMHAYEKVEVRQSWSANNRYRLAFGSVSALSGNIKGKTISSLKPE